MARIRLSFNIAIGQDRGRDRVAIQPLAQFSNGFRVRLKHMPLFNHECAIHYIGVVDKGKKQKSEGGMRKVEGTEGENFEFGSRNAEVRKESGNFEFGSRTRRRSDNRGTMPRLSMRKVEETESERLRSWEGGQKIEGETAKGWEGDTVGR